MYDIEVKRILKQSEKEMFLLHHPYVGTEHMILAILKSNSFVSEILNKYSLTYKRFKTSLVKIVGRAEKKSEIALYTPLLKKTLIYASNIAKEENVDISARHLFIALLDIGEGIGVRILLNMEIDVDSIYDELKDYNGSINKNELLIHKIGRIIKVNSNERVYKREKEIKQILETLLRKSKCNPLLIGEAGVGKSAIIEELARLINDKNVPEGLYDYEIVALDTGSLISGTKYRGDFEERLTNLIEEIVHNKKIILFIDEIHTLINCGGAEGAVDAANILKPYLARGDIKIIGATTTKEYKLSIEKDKALDRRFQKIIVEEPNLKDTEYILKKIKQTYEEHHNVLISDENISDIVKYADKYIFNKYNPDKSIDILDSVCAHVQCTRPNKKNALSVLEKKKESMLLQKKYKMALETELKIKDLMENTDKIQITKADIITVIEYKANIPVLDIFSKRLSMLSTNLKSTIYGQDMQIDEIVKLLKEKYLVDNNKVLSILLTGPIGTGKTYTAVAIANALFGEKFFLKIDMSEFSSDSALSRLLGTHQGYAGYEEEALLDKIKEQPYSIILLDNVERASKKVQKVFSDIIENGYIHNSKGEKIYFNNSTIIMTETISNFKNIGFNNLKHFQSNIETELLDCIDKVIDFSKIDKLSAKKYIKRETGNIKITSKDYNVIIERANIDKYGMRGLQKELNRYKIDKVFTKV